MTHLDENPTGILATIDIEAIDRVFGEQIAEQVMNCDEMTVLYALIRLCSTQIDVLIEAQQVRLRRFKSV